MRLKLEYASESERIDYLKFIAYTLRIPDASVEVVEKAFLDSLAQVCRQAYGVGAAGEAERFFRVDNNGNKVLDEEEKAAELVKYVQDRNAMLKKELARAEKEKALAVESGKMEEPLEEGKEPKIDYITCLKDQIALTEEQLLETDALHKKAICNKCNEKAVCAKKAQEQAEAKKLAAAAKAAEVADKLPVEVAPVEFEPIIKEEPAKEEPIILENVIE